MINQLVCRPNRKRLFVIISLATIASFLAILTMAKSPGDIINQFISSPDKITLSEDDEEQDKAYTIDTTGCQIPYLNPMDWSVMQFINFDLPPLPCGVHVKQLTKMNGDHLTIDYTSLKHFSSIPHEEYEVTCCYRTIRRTNKFLPDTDEVNDYSYCTPINGSEMRIRDEFIRVTCYQKKTLIYTNYHSIGLLKPHVEVRCKKRMLHRKKHTKHSKPTKKWPPINILFFGLDAVSRLNAYRHLTDVIRVLDANTDLFDIAGFNKIGDNTLPNLIAMLTGRTMEEEQKGCLRGHLNTDGCNFIWKNYSRNGYRTIYGEDVPWISTFNYLRHGFNHQPTDYYLRPMLTAAATDFFWYEKGNTPICMGNFTQINYALNWLEQILKVLDGQQLTRPSFSVLWLNSLTHDFLNAAHYAQQPVAKFFRDAYDSGILRNSIVFFLSDHGQRWGSIRQTFIGHMEERLPTFFLALPKWFRQRYPKSFAALERNTKRLVNPLDVYATLVHLMDQHTIDDDPPPDFNLENNRSLSLFRDIPETRTCADIGIAEHFCACHNSQPLPTDNAWVNLAAKEVLETINGLTNPYRYQCANVSINRVISALLNTPRYANSTFHQNNSRGVFADTVTVSIETVPGNGQFEGTVSFRNMSECQNLQTIFALLNMPRIDGQLTLQIVGPISRINMYKNDSECVDDAILKKFCYCIDTSK